MQKTLILLRHAKTETGSAGQDDKARRLIPRGNEATRIIGNWLVEKGLIPDYVLCSDAIRTTETVLGIEHAYKRPLPVNYTPKLYLASANEILNVIEAVPENVSRLMVVAHNPGVHELAMKLARNGDDSLIDKMAIKFPTCAVATFACHTPDWATIRSARTELSDFVSPKMLGQVI